MVEGTNDKKRAMPDYSEILAKRAEDEGKKKKRETKVANMVKTQEILNDARKKREAEEKAYSVNTLQDALPLITGLGDMGDMMKELVPPVPARPQRPGRAKTNANIAKTTRQDGRNSSNSSDVSKSPADVASDGSNYGYTNRNNINIKVEVVTDKGTTYIKIQRNDTNKVNMVPISLYNMLESFINKMKVSDVSITAYNAFWDKITTDYVNNESMDANITDIAPLIVNLTTQFEDKKIPTELLGVKRPKINPYYNFINKFRLNRSGKLYSPTQNSLLIREKAASLFNILSRHLLDELKRKTKSNVRMDAPKKPSPDKPYDPFAAALSFLNE